MTLACVLLVRILTIRVKYIPTAYTVKRQQRQAAIFHRTPAMDEHSHQTPPHPAAAPATTIERQRSQHPCVLAPGSERRQVSCDRRRAEGGRRRDDQVDRSSAHRADPALPERWAAFQEHVAVRVAEAVRQRPESTHEPQWLTADQAAAYLGMSLRALYSAVERRQVPATRLGRRLRFNRGGLDRLLSSPRGGGLHSRVPSPGKDSERW